MDVTYLSRAMQAEVHRKALLAEGYFNFLKILVTKSMSTVQKDFGKAKKSSNDYRC